MGRFLVAVLGLILGQAAVAGEWAPPTDAEWQRLPTFCAVKKREIDKTDPNASLTGVAMIGQQFQNVHHFCFGLTFLNRYHASPFGPKAATNLAMAINEFTYMADHLAPGSALASDIFLYRATALALAKRNGEAQADFRRALEHAPRRERAYIAYADFLVATQQKAEALRIVTEGLRHVPDSPGLRRRYDEWGGKPPYPEPIAGAPMPAGDAPAAPQRPQPAPRTQGVSTEAAEPEDPRRAAPPSAADEPGPGRPASPYCRFCPEQP